VADTTAGLLAGTTVTPGVKIWVPVETDDSTLTMVVADSDTTVDKVTGTLLVAKIVVRLAAERYKDSEKLVVTTPVVPGIVEVSVNDWRMVATLVTVVALATVMVLFDTTKEVDSTMVFDGGGVEVKVVVKVITIGAVPQPEGIIEGPPGKQEARPEY
jgi:hypothetical protein